ncbi:MAG: DUF2793 domain-containing protein [Pseudomonadota bacterium]
MADPQSSLILNLPYIQPSQAQKHVTHNDALRVLDHIVQLAVLARNLTTPPADPAAGDRYVVATGAQDVWAGHDSEIAIFDGNDWVFVPAREGWHAQDLGTGARIVFASGTWQTADLGAVDTLGVNASADPVNRFAVSSEAVLLNHEGAGHQLKVNKAASGDTASLLFQTGFSGRAEMGTAGNDDFSIKVTADGANWNDALVIDAATGEVDAPVASWRKVLNGPRIYFVDPALGDDANDGLSAGAAAFATISRAIGVAQGIDASGHAITIRLADGSYALSGALSINHAVIGGEQLIIEGNTAAPTQVTISASDEVFDVAGGALLLRGIQVGNSSGTKPAIQVKNGGRVTLDRVDFAASGQHIRAENAQLRIEGDYDISGGAEVHIYLSDGARFVSDSVSVTLNGAPAFAFAFVRCDTGSSARFTGTSFSGSATALRYAITGNGVVDTAGAGATYLPGDTVGTIQSGGQYL